MESEKKGINLNKLITALGIIIVILVVFGILLSGVVNDIAYVSVKNYAAKIIDRTQKLMTEYIVVDYELTDKEKEMYNKYMDEKNSQKDDGRAIEIDEDSWTSFKALYKESREVEQ